MQPIQVERVINLLRQFEGKEAYVHFEAIPGGFVRNAKVLVEAAYAAGEGPYRIALKLTEDGWIRAEGLTDYTVTEREALLFAGHDEQGRLTAALELSLEPFIA